MLCPCLVTYHAVGDFIVWMADRKGGLSLFLLAFAFEFLIHTFLPFCPQQIRRVADEEKSLLVQAHKKVGIVTYTHPHLLEPVPFVLFGFASHTPLLKLQVVLWSLIDYVDFASHLQIPRHRPFCVFQYEIIAQNVSRSIFFTCFFFFLTFFLISRLIPGLAWLAVQEIRQGECRSLSFDCLFLHFLFSS